MSNGQGPATGPKAKHHSLFRASSAVTLRDVPEACAKYPSSSTAFHKVKEVSLLSRRRRFSTPHIEVGCSQGRRTIHRCDNISDLYELQGEVMPSCHRDMEIKHAVARRSSTLGQVIVKVRRKPGSFVNKQDEQAWRASTELLLNLPASSSICKIYEVWEDPRAYYVVMEKVAGMDLCETTHAAGKLPVQEVKEVMRQLLQGVAEMHENGCIHKDIKLENVMLDRSASVSPSSPSRKSPTNRSTGCRRPLSASLSSQSLPCSPCSVKLIDFDTLIDWSPKSPKARDIVGTNQYIAPEAYKGHYSPASDIFSVGVIMYYLLTGDFPFDDRIFANDRGCNTADNPKMREFSSRVLNSQISWDYKVFESEPAAKRLLQTMLSGSFAYRPSALAALRHPWFAGMSNQSSAPSADNGRLSMVARAVLGSTVTHM